MKKPAKRDSGGSVVGAAVRAAAVLTFFYAAISGAALALGRTDPDAGKIYFTIDGGAAGRDQVIFDPARLVDFNLSFHQGIVNDPVISPDAGQIAFVASAAGLSEIRTFSFQSGKSRSIYSKEELQPFMSSITNLAWSSSEQYLGFTSDGKLLKYDFVNDRLTLAVPYSQPSGFNDVNLAWSNDGRWIAFASASRETTNWQVYLGSADGSSVQRITRADVCLFYRPNWSPSANLIVIEGTCDNLATLFLFDVESGSLKALANLPTSMWGAEWSPDGSQLLFTSGTNVQDQWLYTVSADGSVLRRLVDGSSAYWSPDGRMILYRSRLGDLYTIRADGSDQRRLTFTNGQTLLFPLAWSR
ncbi:MAG: hypothetical protein ABI700_13135 [Chloroflexota bacterium]